MEGGIRRRKGGRKKAFRFQDDQAMPAGNQKGLQKMMYQLNMILVECNTKVNVK